MAEIRAVGFDLDGTLFDHRGSATDAVDAFLRLIGALPSDDARELWFSAEDAEFERWRTGQISFQEQRRRRLQTVLPALGVAIEDNPVFLDELFEEYLREYQAAWRAFPDAVDVLTSLRSQGFRLGILTNGNEEQQLEKLRTIGLYESVDVVCVSEAIGVQKPDPRAFKTLAQRLGVTPAECLFVGDNPQQDVAGAIAAGMSAKLIERYRESADGLASALDLNVDYR
ncbi:HAD family hydrolase [Microbacterium sp. A93]|uniref:HAD family hydrolase n=1 Tax=Microbacterium sp. A93 TaxID=3450716 RepID=UPI003F443C7E